MLLRLRNGKACQISQDNSVAKSGALIKTLDF